MNSKMLVKYPIAIQWNIPEGRLQEIRRLVHGRYDSEMFEIPGTNDLYYISIFPNGINDESRGKTWISLLLEFENQKEIKIEYSIFIDSANFSEKVEYVYKDVHDCGNFVCEFNELFDPEKQFIVDGEMCVRMEGYFMIEKEAPENLCKLGKSKNELCVALWNQQNKDFAIVSEGKEIQAHKCVLAGRSPVFAAMFQPHTKEAQESKVEIPDFTFDVVDAAIKFSYDSSLVVEAVSYENQLSLLQFFDKYDIQLLKNQLEEHLISVIDETNVCLLANTSIISNSLKLRRKCFEFLHGCLKNTAINDFDLLDKDFVYDLVKNSFSKFSD